MSFFKKNKRIKGISMVEMVVYVAILSAVFVMVVNTLLVVTNSYKAIKIANDLNNSASVSLERLNREIRLASSVNTTQSVLNSHPGQLVLSTVDEAGDPLSLMFFVENDILKLSKDSAFFGNLTRDNVVVDNLVFRHITSSTSEAVKIEMQLTATEGSNVKTDTFYSSAVLRGSY